MMFFQSRSKFLLFVHLPHEHLNSPLRVLREGLVTYFPQTFDTCNMREMTEREKSLRQPGYNYMSKFHKFSSTKIKLTRQFFSKDISHGKI